MTATDPPEAPGDPPRAVGRMESRGTWVDIIVDQAMRRGDFDNLPLAGKPLPGLDRHDDDWWLRGLVERERLDGQGFVPEALALRAQDERMQATLDGLRREEQVRAHLTEFNRRVVAARRQLAGGPPVVTASRDVEAEVAAWRARRADGRVSAAPDRSRRRRPGRPR